MFHRINPSAATLRITFNGTEIPATEGETVAAALLAAGITHTRDTHVHHQPRGPFCLMGICFDCLVEIDGAPNRQACMTIVRDGMVITAQRGARNVP
jgi:predicted molibdopterin-dependent oxidoreductase YjgC